VSHDGVKSRPVTAEDDVPGNNHGAQPRIPAFLESSLQSMKLDKECQAH
jgi:protein-tyrosine phosphatase